jgi:prepilin-type N-terminal cleavage/methylation domain-containing protein
MDDRGMTLIEVLVALVVLALALLALMPLFVGAVKTVASSNQLTSANTLVREKLEELNGYPRDDPRLTVPDGANAAVPTGGTVSGATVAVNTFCDNDLPSWYRPSTGEVSTASTSPGADWYAYPYVRTYTIEQLGPIPIPGAPDDAWMKTRVSTPSAYAVKLVTVTVRPTRGLFPGLRQTTQSLYLRLPNV